MNEFKSARIKKEAEEKALGYFFEAYERVTDQSITLVEITRGQISFVPERTAAKLA
jgi:hypothetical protein